MTQLQPAFVGVTTNFLRRHWFLEGFLSPCKDIQERITSVFQWLKIMGIHIYCQPYPWPTKSPFWRKILILLNCSSVRHTVFSSFFASERLCLSKVLFSYPVMLLTLFIYLMSNNMLQFFFFEMTACTRSHVDTVSIFQRHAAAFKWNMS